MPLIDSNYYTQHDKNEPEYFTPDSKPYGLTYRAMDCKMVELGFIHTNRN